MFSKYIKINIKNHFLQYLSIIVFEIFLLLAILISNGIFLDYASKENSAEYFAKFFEFSFGSRIRSSEISEKIEEFAEKIPYEFDYMAIDMSSGTDNLNDKYTGNVLFLFSDYEHLKKHMLKYFVKSVADLPTEEQFNNKSKTVLVGGRAGITRYLKDVNDEISPFTPEFQFDDNGKIISFDEKYEVCGRFNGDGIVFFWGSQPSNALISGLCFQMSDIVNEKQAQEIYELYSEIFGQEPAYVELPKVQGLLEQRTNAANILVSLLLIVISVLNIMLVFRYLLSSKKTIFAVFRFCGFNKSVCLKYSFAEFMLISLVSSAASLLVFNQIIKPFMTNYYGIFDTVYTVDYYFFLFGMFIAACAAMFFIYIAPSLSKSVTAELREI